MPHLHANRPTLPTSSAALETAREIDTFARGAVGNISGEDAGFLLTMIERERPRHVLELGVASGTSSLAMLRHLDRHQAAGTLDSVDIAETYYADTARPVGYLVQAYYGSRPGSWRLVTGVGAAGLDDHPLLAGTTLARHYDLAFIDAHHGHPWPALDLLCLLPFLRPGAWVLLHDINLPVIGEYPLHGAVHVVRDWSGDVLISEDPLVPNCGAVRLDDAGPRDAERLLGMLGRSWDVGLDRGAARKIEAHLARHLGPSVQRAVQRAIAANAAVPVG